MQLKIPSMIFNGRINQLPYHVKTAFKKPPLSGYQWMCILYVAVAVYCWQFKYFRHIDNNYLIFQASFHHLKNHDGLYRFYPYEYNDVFLYGPVFAVFMAPMALLPEGYGFFIWEVINAAGFLWAVYLLPFTNKIKVFVLLFCAVEFANSVHFMQVNPIIASLIIMSFLFVKREKEQYATLFIAFGTLVKLYPVIGLAFFVFSKHKMKFISWLCIWAVVFLCLPALVSGPGFLIECYRDWFAELVIKNQQNTDLNSAQDWCMMGVARRLFQNNAVPDWPFLVAGGIVFGIPLLRVRQYGSQKFQLQVLCAALLMVVIFSTGSEHPTFIIATAGAVIYIFMQAKPFTPLKIALLSLLLIITGLGPSDAFPVFMRVWMQGYAMKAWPCIIIWLKIAFELIFKDFLVDNDLPTGFSERSDISFLSPSSST